MSNALCDHTTLEVGGEARRIVQVSTCEEALAVYQEARSQELPLLVLGGGSNMLVADQGFPGLVVRWMDKGLEILHQTSEEVLVRVGGGWNWDDWVAESVYRDWAGLECLSGIPGTVGAAPIQNIGAYGQEVGDRIVGCWVLEWESGELSRLTASECCFGYRMSRFKQDWRGRFLVTAVEFRLQPGGPPQLRYKELQQKFGQHRPGLVEVRKAVREIRREKSMLWDPTDPNHRSAGSFFMNPVVPQELADRLAEGHPGMPVWPTDRGAKLSAAWLIERSGFPKGYGQGAAGLSSKHVLALVNRGRARASDIVALAREIRHKVQQCFGVLLHPEPEFVGFDRTVEELLA